MSFLDLTGHETVHVRLRPGYEIALSPDRASFVLRSYGRPLPLGRAHPAFPEAFAALRDGAPLAVLRDHVLAAAGAHAAGGFLIWLQRLSRIGILDYPLVAGGRRVAVVLPQTGSIVPLPTGEPGSRPLSHFAYLRRAGDEWLLEHPLVGARLAFDDPRIVSSLMRPDAGPGETDADVGLVLDVLAGLGFLDEPDVPDGRAGEAAERARTLRQWEFHDLAFHFHSRRGWHFDPVGGVFPHIGEIDPLPSVRPAWEGPRIALERAPEGDGKGDDGSRPLAAVMERRRSERHYADGSAPSLGEIGILLDRVARVRDRSVTPVTNFLGRSGELPISRRPYPNGGASYELEIYAVVDRCDGLDPGIYHYDAGDHCLVRLAGRSAETDRMMRDAVLSTAGLATPQVLFVITARFARVMWKYKSIAYAVILRNAGVLYQTLYLVATDMGLSPCGIGTGDSALFAAATGLDPVVEGSVGEFILGGRPRP